MSNIYYAQITPILSLGVSDSNKRLKGMADRDVSHFADDLKGPVFKSVMQACHHVSSTGEPAIVENITSCQVHGAWRFTGEAWGARAGYVYWFEYEKIAFPVSSNALIDFIPWMSNGVIIASFDFSIPGRVLTARLAK